MKKHLHIVLVALLALVISLTVVPKAGLADLGDFAGDSDYGDSGWDSGSSWGSSDDDYYDDDYDGDGGSFDFDLDGDGQTSLLEFFMGIASFLVFGGIVLAAGMWFEGRDERAYRRRMKKEQKSGKDAEKSQESRTADHSNLKSMSTYRQVDPNFDVTEFCERASNLYVKMQNAWTAKDLDPVRPYFTPAFFAQLERQLEPKVKLGQTNYVDRIAVLDVKPLGWCQTGGYDHIVLTIQTRIVDYTLDDKTGELVTGDKRAEKFMTYEWDLSRKTGTLTGEHAELETVNCPNCGAPINLNATAKCPYCDSVITVEHEDWAVCKIKGISQRTGR